MRKVSVTIEVDLKNDEKGFVIVPTSEAELLKGKYVVTVGRGVAEWNCRNSVTLIAGQDKKRPAAKTARTAKATRATAKR